MRMCAFLLPREALVNIRSRAASRAPLLQIRFEGQEGPRDFDKGCLRNTTKILCSKLPDTCVVLYIASCSAPSVDPSEHLYRTGR